jgi:homoserine kinase type II
MSFVPTPPDPRQIIRHWLPEPGVTLHPMTTGTNNTTYRVETGDQHFMLRLTLDTGAASRLSREISLLATLQQLNLPFKTPAPVKTGSGEWILRDETTESPVLATLFRAIEGSPVDRGDLALTRQAGTALAILDRALAEESIEAVDPLIAPGELRDVRISPDAAFSQVELAETYRTMEAIADRWEHNSSLFPHQAIHADYYPANILAHQGQLTGIIDFELSLSGPRILDLAIGLWTFAGEIGSFNWQAVDVFTKGYAQISPPAAQEIAAIPDLIAFREAGSLAHWSKRYAKGLIEEGKFQWRIERLKQVHSTMEQTGQMLVDRVSSAVQDVRQET